MLDIIKCLGQNLAKKSTALRLMGICLLGFTARIDIEPFMRPGICESLDMVLRYTRSVKFEDSLRLYQEIEALPKG